MADDFTPGEFRRALDRLEQAQRDGQRAVDDRITKLAGDMLRTEVWTAEHKALVDDVRHLEADMVAATARIEATSQERMATLRSETKAVRADVAAVRAAQADHIKQHETDNSWSRSKTLTIIGIIAAASATIIGAWIAAFAAAGGVGK